MLALWARLRTACRARFLAWAEFATASTLLIRARDEKARNYADRANA